MAARLNNAPAYVVYDRTTQCGITNEVVNGQTTPVNNIHGTFNDMIDKDTTTYYGLDCIGSSSSGTPTYYYSVIYDAKKIIWNTQISVKYELIVANPTFQTRHVSISTDGSTWTTLDQTPNSLMEWSISAMQFRYLKFNVTSTSTYGDIGLKVYEVKIMGSD